MHVKLFIYIERNNKREKPKKSANAPKPPKRSIIINRHVQIILARAKYHFKIVFTITTISFQIRLHFSCMLLKLNLQNHAAHVIREWGYWRF